MELSKEELDKLTFLVDGLPPVAYVVKDLIPEYPEDKDELTDRQQEKYDWLDEFASTLEEVIDNVSEAVDSPDTED